MPDAENTIIHKLKCGKSWMVKILKIDTIHHYILCHCLNFSKVEKLEIDKKRMEEGHHFAKRKNNTHTHSLETA